MELLFGRLELQDVLLKLQSVNTYSYSIERRLEEYERVLLRQFNDFKVMQDINKAKSLNCNRDIKNVRQGQKEVSGFWANGIAKLESDELETKGVGVQKRVYKKADKRDAIKKTKDVQDKYIKAFNSTLQASVSSENTIKDRMGIGSANREDAIRAMQEAFEQQRIANINEALKLRKAEEEKEKQISLIRKEAETEAKRLEQIKLAAKAEANRLERIRKEMKAEADRLEREREKEIMEAEVEARKLERAEARRLERERKAAEAKAEKEKRAKEKELEQARVAAERAERVRAEKEAEELRLAEEAKMTDEKLDELEKSDRVQYIAEISRQVYRATLKILDTTFNPYKIMLFVDLYNSEKEPNIDELDTKVGISGRSDYKLDRVLKLGRYTEALTGISYLEVKKLFVMDELSIPEIANKLGKSLYIVEKYIKCFGFEELLKFKKSKELRELYHNIHELYIIQNKSRSDIAEALNMSRKSLDKYIVYFGLYKMKYRVEVDHSIEGKLRKIGED